MPLRRGAGKSARKPIPTAERRVRISEKDPCVLCGKDTSVERVFRVEEKLEKSKVMHLVFFDRHGWYCEHGVKCPAVADVKKFIRTR